MKIILDLYKALLESIEEINDEAGTFETASFWAAMFIIMYIVLKNVLPVLPNADSSVFNAFPKVGSNKKIEEKDDAVSIETVPKDGKELPDKVNILFWKRRK